MSKWVLREETQLTNFRNQETLKVRKTLLLRQQMTKTKKGMHSEVKAAGSKVKAIKTNWKL